MTSERQLNMSRCQANPSINEVCAYAYYAFFDAAFHVPGSMEAAIGADFNPPHVGSTWCKCWTQAYTSLPGIQAFPPLTNLPAFGDCIHEISTTIKWYIYNYCE